MGLRVIVQSERSAAHVEERINAFWADYRKTLDEMSEDEFAKYKMAVVNKKLEDHKNMWQESMTLWTQIHSGWLDFGLKKRDAELVRGLTKQDIVDFFHAFFFDKPDHRVRRVSVHCESQRLSAEQCAGLLPLLGPLGVELDPAQVAAFAASKPTVEVASAFAQGLLAQAGKSEAEMAPLLEAIRRLADKGSAPEGVELIADANAWRVGQAAAPHGKPVAEYAYLFGRN